MSDGSDSNPETQAGEAQFEFAIDDRNIQFELDEELYPLDSIYGASYIFIDRCYVFLTRPRDQFVTVRLRRREPADEETMMALAGEFANELLNQVLRQRIARSTSGIREQYMARAFFSNKPQDTIAQLMAELDAEELAEDALEVPVPWENETGPEDIAAGNEGKAGG